MSWSIAVTKNTVLVTEKCAKELFDAQPYEGAVWDSVEDVSQDDHLYFNGDHREHMDWLSSEPQLVAILKKNKISGDICFGSLEGDNAGTFWGYRFDKGKCTPLQGMLSWEKAK